MKILIAGDGKVGLALTRKLSAEGHDITLIDSDREVLESSMDRYDVMAVNGNCVSMEVLKNAGVMQADLLIAATSADEINLLSCMTAHGLNKNLHTIARIRNPEYREQIYQMRDVFALSMMVNPERQAAIEIERLLKYPGFLKRETFAKGRVEIVEIRIDEKSPLCNIALNDLHTIIKCKVLVCSVFRDGDVITPGGNFVLRAGDRIFVTAASDNLTQLLKNLGMITHKVKDVIICGGGRVSYYLAAQLIKSGIGVKIIEKEYDRCIELSNYLPEVEIIHGDASSQYLLDSENISGCDALVTATGIDEVNMIISLYGKTCKIPQVITKVGHMGNSRLQDTLSVGSVVCPKELIVNNIIRYIRAMQNKTGAALAVHSIADGLAEAMEFKVDDTTRHCGEELRKIRIKKGVLIACITHESTTIIPDGESMYVQGDTIIVVAAGKDMVITQINNIFE